MYTVENTIVSNTVENTIAPYTVQSTIEPYTVENTIAPYTVQSSIEHFTIQITIELYTGQNTIKKMPFTIERYRSTGQNYTIERSKYHSMVYHSIIYRAVNHSKYRWMNGIFNGFQWWNIPFKIPLALLLANTIEWYWMVFSMVFQLYSIDRFL